MNCIQMETLEENNTDDGEEKEVNCNENRPRKMKENNGNNGGLEKAKGAKRFRGMFFSVVTSIKNVFVSNSNNNNNSMAKSSSSNSALCLSFAGRSRNVNLKHQYDSLPNCEEENVINNDNNILSPMSTDTTVSMTRSEVTLDDEDIDPDLYADMWDDEELTCNVCDRAFATPKLLERHQRKRRHWGCNICEGLFDSENLLEQHKDEFDHWSDDEDNSSDDDGDGIHLNQYYYNSSDVDEDGGEMATAAVEGWFMGELQRRRRIKELQDVQETVFGSEKGETSMLL